MKAFRFGLVIMAAAMIIFGLGGTAVAFHDGGVAHCDGCHTMHQTTVNDGATVGAHLTKGSDPSSTCLACHAGYGQLGDGAWRSGGDFYWLTKDFTWVSHGTKTSPGMSHGHSILAADFGLTTVDTDNPTAPGSTGNTVSYSAGQLGCNSCHDPHGKQGNEVLLYGQNEGGAYLSGDYIFSEPAPIFLNAGRNTDVSNTTHSTYVRGMSEWCGNCHKDFVNAVLMHPAGNNTGAAMGDYYANYNAYVKTGDTSNIGANYWEIVPFETGGTTTSGLTTGDNLLATAGSNAMCLTCHRAHATPFKNIARWDFGATLISESHPDASTTGVSGSDLDNIYYGYTFDPEQRSLCNKCHVQD